MTYEIGAPAAIFCAFLTARAAPAQAAVADWRRHLDELAIH